jgi:hypothetical protein
VTTLMQPFRRTRRRRKALRLARALAMLEQHARAARPLSRQVVRVSL